MNELANIVDTWFSLSCENQDAVLATVVHVKGSAYRRPGARMLLVPDGRRLGTISGGCLEGEISRKAWWFTAEGIPVVRVYDTTSDEDAVWEFGLGCNGIVQVMLERASSASARALFHFLRRNGSERPAVVATVVRSSMVVAGERLFLGASGMPEGPLTKSKQIEAYAKQAFDAKSSRYVHLDNDPLLGDAEVFFEWIAPRQSLIIFGAGHDAAPVVRFAAELGWSVTVADCRPAYAKTDCFPEAERVIVMAQRDLLRDIVVTEDTAVVIMTHNYPLDGRLLPEILKYNPCYLGMLGPRNRAERLFDELNLDPPATVHAPVGLDIGCDTPAAIALSIVSEVQAALEHRQGGKLCHRRGPIHAPALETGAAGMQTLAESVRPAFCEATAYQ
jgi:xanthine dehydrogenase accessory factor